MSVICPTITAYNSHQYREQTERIQIFANRVHIDFMDGIFAKPKSVELSGAWWPEHIKADLHLMFQEPANYIDFAIKLKPNLVIMHAEADGNFAELSHKLSTAGIKVGIAILQTTGVDEILPVLDNVDHVLVFSGNLGHHGGTADLKMVEKIKKLSQLKPNIELGWDGGVDLQNAESLINGGVDVLNVGSFIQQSTEPINAYDKLKQITLK